MPRLVRPEDSDNNQLVYGQASGGGQGSKTHTESEMRNDGIIETILMGNQTSYDYGAILVPQQNNINVGDQGINSSSPRHQSSDDILALQEMGCLVQDININPQSSSTNFHFVPAVYAHDQVYI